MRLFLAGLCIVPFFAPNDVQTPKEGVKSTGINAIVVSSGVNFTDRDYCAREAMRQVTRGYLALPSNIIMCSSDAQGFKDPFTFKSAEAMSVSYTHLTLPTIYSV